MKLLTERVTAAERLASESKRSEQQAIHKRNAMEKKLKAMEKKLKATQNVLKERRVAHEQSRQYPVVVQERDKALDKAIKLTKRATAAERLLIEEKTRLTEVERLVTKATQQVTILTDLKY